MSDSTCPKNPGWKLVEGRKGSVFAQPITPLSPSVETCLTDPTDWGPVVCLVGLVEGLLLVICKVVLG
jgi:hypothetical protein